MRRLAAASFVLAAALVAGTAAASTAFPDALTADLALSYVPKCDLCHEAAAPPAGAASKPFCVSLVARGLVGKDVTSLATALGRMKADHVDSDGDGAQDLDEVSWGGDPNHAELPQGGAQDAVTYGCSTAPGTGSGLGLGLGLGAILAWCSRRASKSS